MSRQDPPQIGRHLATFNLFREADNSLQVTVAEARGVRQELNGSGAPLHLCAMNALRAATARDSMALLQANVGQWMVDVFGQEIAMDPLERVMRFLEEALELAQALGMTAEECGRVVDYVYGRPAGEPRQEVGGVMITLAALCFRLGIDLDGGALDEFARIDSPEMRKRIFEKQAFKRAQGLTSDGGFRQPAPDLGFVERSEGGPGRTSIKKSHRAEGRNFVD